jgi:hypothetical protein
MLLTALPGWGAATTVQTTFLTTLSGSNQTYSVPSTFVSNVSVEVVSSGGGGFDESTTDGSGNGDFGGGGSGGYAIKSGVTMVAGGTVTYGLSVSSAVYFGGSSLAASSVGILNGSGAGGTHQGASGASTAGAKGDTTTGGTAGTADSSIGGSAPPAAAISASSGSGLTNAGYGQNGTAATYPGQGFIKIINIVTVP